MKLTVHTTREYTVSEAEVILARRLFFSGGEYLFDEESDLADKSPLISNPRENWYEVSTTGRNVVRAVELNKQIIPEILEIKNQK